MRVIHLSYTIPKPAFTDPEVWLRRINHSIGVLESMTKFAEIIGIYHIQYKGVLRKNEVEYHFPGFSRFQLLFPLQFNRYIRKLRPDVVIVHGLIFPWQVVMLRFQVGQRVKIIAQHHAERPLRDIRKHFQLWADRFIHAYLFASHDQGKEWVDRGQIQSMSKIREIMGTSSPFYPMDRREARIKKGVSGSPVFIWVGGLDSNKDPITVVKAFIRFSKLNPSANLLMIYQTEQLLGELQKLISDHAAAKYIQLVGKVNNADLLDWYNSADFVISSSHYEGSGIAVCEALSCACVPILTNIPSFRMMSDNGNIGLLFEPGSEESLFESLHRVESLNLENEKAKVLNKFREDLSFDANARKIMEVINS